MVTHSRRVSSCLTANFPGDVMGIRHAAFEDESLKPGGGSSGAENPATVRQHTAKKLYTY